MKRNTLLSILVMALPFLAGCPSTELAIYYAQIWNAEFSVTNETSQDISLVFKTCDYSNFDSAQPCWIISSRHPSQEEVKAESQREIRFQMFADGTEATLSFLAEMAGQTYIGWNKDLPVGSTPEEATPLQPAPLQSDLGYFQLKDGAGTWHGGQAKESPLPEGWPPTARYAVTITTGADGTPKAEFTLTELLY